MLNIIGRMPELATLLRIPGVHVHDYCKAPRANRKLGHCTLVGADRDSVSERLIRLRAIVDRVTIP